MPYLSIAISHYSSVPSHFHFPSPSLLSPLPPSHPRLSIPSIISDGPYFRYKLTIMTSPNNKRHNNKLPLNRPLSTHVPRLETSLHKRAPIRRTTTQVRGTAGGRFSHDHEGWSREEAEWGCQGEEDCLVFSGCWQGRRRGDGRGEVSIDMIFNWR